MLAILAECVFQRLRAARKQATKDTILFADDPVSKTILANKDSRPSGASGRILDELHDRNPRTIVIRSHCCTARADRSRYVFWCCETVAFLG